MLLKHELATIASDIRHTDALLASAISALAANGTWSGDDADAFERRWNDEVRSHLMIAATVVDGLEFVTA